MSVERQSSISALSKRKTDNFQSEIPCTYVSFFSTRSGRSHFPPKAVYTDTLRNEYSKEHSTHPIRMSRICGPVEVVNDTTFTVRFYRMGLDNPKRTGGICPMASVKQDHKYRSAVQQVEIRIPYRNKEGIPQSIIFPKLSDVKASVKEISLNGTADSGTLPVYYYVKEGPAEIKGDKLALTKIPHVQNFR